MIKLSQKVPGQWHLFDNGEAILHVSSWIVDLMRNDDSLDLFESWLQGAYDKAQREGHKEGVQQVQDNLRLIMGESSQNPLVNTF